MLTPSFKVDQDNDSVTITIDAPYVRAQDVDLYVEDSEFRFYLRPYFLRIHFPGNIVEDEQFKTAYDPSPGQFTIKISKVTKGEHFPDLDMLSKLLARKGEADKDKNKDKKPLIEVIGETTDMDVEGGEEKNEFQDAIDFNWEIPQQVPTAPDLQLAAHYGFNNQYTGYFRHVQETMNEINELENIEQSTLESRHEERLERENISFDEDHYCMDYINNDEIQDLIKFKSVYAKELKRIQKNSKEAEVKKPLIQEVTPNDASTDIDMNGLKIEDTQESLIKFTSKDNEFMRNLPRKEYLLSNEKSTYLGLVDLMFAYSYNYRLTEGENNVESVWCIGKISSMLSSLEQHITLKEVIVSSFRRALTYPLYRNFELCEKILQDVYILFKLGKRAILKALLDMKDVFDHHDVYYIYSKVYLDDYCVWIQHASDNVLRTLAHELHHFVVKKEETGWELEELEEVARHMSQMEGEMGQDMQRAELMS
ncbi:SHQ1-domain-containing protein [Backusella circina FSU 941]|nr:SHQ1-domain-containing protein [Backusella circina FSU 941]